MLYDEGLLVRGMYATSFFPSNTTKINEFFPSNTLKINGFATNQEIP